MAYALSPNVSEFREPVRERAALTVAVSVLLHVAVGWAVLNLIVVRTLPERDPPLTIEIAPPAAMPASQAPTVSPDTPDTLPERPRSELAPPRPDNPEAPPAAAPPQPTSAATGASGAPGIASGPVGPPAAAPRPTYRAPIAFPHKAQVAERKGVAVVEVLIAAGGSVTDARLVSETPKGYGFGEAAMESVRQWRFETAQPGVYRVTVRFALE